MNEETVNYAYELLEVIKQIREKVITTKIPIELKENKDHILLETFYISLKDLIEKSIEEGEPRYVSPE